MDRVAITGPRDASGYHRIRGRDLLVVLRPAGIASVVPADDGVFVHHRFVSDALGALSSAGYSIAQAGEAGGQASKPPKAELPECAECHVPFRRTRPAPRPGEACWQCGAPLVLVVNAERRCHGGEACPSSLNPCPPGKGRTHVVVLPFYPELAG